MSDYCQDENVFCNMLKNIMLYFLGSSLNLNLLGSDLIVPFEDTLLFLQG